MTLTKAPVVFYTHPRSRGRVVRWMLEEIGHPYDTKLLEYNTSMKAPEYLAIHPMGKVPAIKHGEAVVTEVVAICTYLADMFPQAGLLPETQDAKAKAEYYRWLFFVAGPLEAAVANKILNVAIPQEKKTAIGHGGVEEVCSILHAAVKGKDFIAGDRFSTADLIVSSYLGFYSMFGMIPPDVEFERYVKLHKARPAAVRALEIDENLVKRA